MARRDGPSLYRGCAPVVDTRFEIGREGGLVEALADAIAEAEGVDVRRLSPLYEAVDVDALDQLFERSRAEGRADCLVEFAVDDWVVFVRADGRVRVCDTTRPTGPKPVFGPILG